MYNGIINVYKEEGFTSHDVVAKLRGILKQKKIGHTGTLDPDAKGVLPVCLGKATKLCDMITDKSKVYETKFFLGVTTDTQDMSGKVLKYTNVFMKDNGECGRESLEKKSSIVLTDNNIIETINSFLGEYAQVPPMYSALKVNGKKLYELAREGKVVERKARNVRILSLDIKKVKDKKIEINVDNKNDSDCDKESINVIEVSMVVGCSKGTYIRTLCHDIGEKLGCGASMDKLVRCRVGIFELENSIKLSDIEELVKDDKLDSNIVSIEDMFLEYKRADIKKDYTRLLDNGNKVSIDNVCLSDKLDLGEKVRMYNMNSEFVAIYELVDSNILKPIKMFL